MKIAVIGSGISGLSAAYYLSKKYHVDLYEKEDHFGGHSHTVEIKNDKKSLAVDVGFIVFNELTYPNLIKFFHEIDAEYEKSNMSFAVSVMDTEVEYSGSGLKGLFSNKKNLFNLSFIKMIFEIINFYKKVPFEINPETEKMTLGEYLSKKKLSNYFVNYHIIPMVASIWSMPYGEAKNIPFKLFVEFFSNHGLFKLKNRPQWFTVKNRSKTYVNKVLKNISGEVYKNYEVKKIVRKNNNIRLLVGPEEEYLEYDHVVLACHADQALKLLEKSPSESEILKNFKYIKNKAYLHSDQNLMPKRLNAWSSWNAISNKDASKTCVTYWLNKLQNLNVDTNYFLTLNPIKEIDTKKIIKEIKFSHPNFDLKAFKLQKKLKELQGKQNTWFCGSYFGYGFHEDGLKSSLELIKRFNIK